MPLRRSVVRILQLTTLVALGLSGLSAAGPALAASPPQEVKKPMSSPLDFKMKSLAGEEVDLQRYRGNVVLIVNTASKCGLTPQYEGLQSLHDKYQGQGLRILGFPANDFAQQEPGTDAQIGEFCQRNYGVKFDMFSKVAVKGADQAPLYRFLTEPATNPQFPGEIRWNFEKFLVGRDGQVIARFDPRVTPESPEVVSAIEAALVKK